MSWSQRSDGRFIVKYKDKGLWKQISFTDKEKAIHFDAMHNAPKEEIRLTMGELIVKYLHGNPDLFHETRERIIWLYADGGPCAFMRDKYADSLNRQDLEQLRENIRGRKASNNTSNHYQAYTRAILAWGVDQGLLVLNPWRDFKKLKISKQSVSVIEKIYFKLAQKITLSHSIPFTNNFPSFFKILETFVLY